MATPGSQQGSGGSDSGDGDLIALYEFCAAEYGWGPDYIEACVTDSQLLEYIERAVTRRTKQSEGDLDRLTIGVNTGYLISHDRDALRRWRARRPSSQNPAQFTATAARLAARFPDKVKTH